MRITIEETPEAMQMRLEGRLAGPWAKELDRVWVETAPQLAARKLTIDLHNVTYADLNGKRVLRSIYAQTHAELLAGSPSTQFLAAEVAGNNRETVEEGN